MLYSNQCYITQTNTLYNNLLTQLSQESFQFCRQENQSTKQHLKNIYDGNFAQKTENTQLKTNEQLLWWKNDSGILL
jgi:hypothetical protein